MPGMDVNPAGLISRGLPQPIADGQTPIIPRWGRYREQTVIPLYPNFAALCDEGTYYTATNATPGTAVSYSITAAFADTAAMITMRNGDGTGGKRLYLDYIRIIQGATVPASSTAGQFACKLDVSLRATAGTTSTPQNPNLDVSQSASIMDFRFTPTVTAASGAARLVSRGVMRSVLPVINDEWVFAFGTVEKSAGILLGGTVAQRMIIPCPPVILGPGNNHTFLLHVWFPGNATTAGNFEYEAGWWER